MSCNSQSPLKFIILHVFMPNELLHDSVQAEDMSILYCREALFSNKVKTKVFVFLFSPEYYIAKSACMDVILSF